MKSDLNPYTAKKMPKIRIVRDMVYFVKVAGALENKIKKNKEKTNTYKMLKSVKV